MDALRRVQVGVGIEVGEADALVRRGRNVAGDRADSDRAIPTKHQRDLTRRRGIGNARGGLAHDRHDRVEILGPRPVAVRAPAPDRPIPVVGHRHPSVT
jgi:hypothetical protein